MSDVNWHRTMLEGVLRLIPATRHRDGRGKYIETWNKKLYDAALRAEWEDRWPLPSLRYLLWKPIDWVQDDISVSKKGVLRGIHGDEKTWKLVSCLHGAFYLVVVNNHPYDEARYKWQGFWMTGNDDVQVLIPPRYGNAHFVLEDGTVFHYKQSTYYEGAEKQFTLKWNDPRLGIEWPAACVNPILSKRDKEAQWLERM